MTPRKSQEPSRLVEEACVLADPAEAGVAGVDALNDRTGVDEAAGPERANFLSEAVAEGFEAAQQDLVVVRGAGVGSWRR